MIQEAGYQNPFRSVALVAIVQPIRMKMNAAWRETKAVSRHFGQHSILSLVVSLTPQNEQYVFVSIFAGFGICRYPSSGRKCSYLLFSL